MACAPSDGPRLRVVDGGGALRRSNRGRGERLRSPNGVHPPPVWGRLPRADACGALVPQLRSFNNYYITSSIFAGPGASLARPGPPR